MTAKEILEKHLNPYYMNGALAKQAEKAMKEYARHIAGQAVGEVKKSYSQINSPITDVALNKILSLIKTLTEEQK